MPRGCAIVLATAGGPDSQSARRAAADLARRHGLPLHVVVTECPDDGSPGADRLSEERDRLVAEGTPVEGAHLVRGCGAQRVLAIAHEIGAGLVVTEVGGPLRDLVGDRAGRTRLRSEAIVVLVVARPSARRRVTLVPSPRVHQVAVGAGGR